MKRSWGIRSFYAHLRSTFVCGPLGSGRHKPAASVTLTRSDGEEFTFYATSVGLRRIARYLGEVAGDLDEWAANPDEYMAESTSDKLHS